MSDDEPMSPAEVLERVLSLDGGVEEGPAEEEKPLPVADPSGVPRQQAVRILARNRAYMDPWTPATASIEALEAAGLRIVHAGT